MSSELHQIQEMAIVTMSLAWRDGSWSRWLKSLRSVYADAFQAQDLRVVHKPMGFADIQGIVSGRYDLDVYEGETLLGGMRWDLQYQGVRQMTERGPELAVRLVLSRSWAPAPSRWPWAGLAAEGFVYPHREAQVKSLPEFEDWLLAQSHAWPEELQVAEDAARLAARVGNYNQ